MLDSYTLKNRDYVLFIWMSSISTIVIGFEWVIVTSGLVFRVCLLHILSMSNYDVHNSKCVATVWIKTQLQNWSNLSLASSQESVSTPYTVSTPAPRLLSCLPSALLPLRFQYPLINTVWQIRVKLMLFSPLRATSLFWLHWLIERIESRVYFAAPQVEVGVLLVMFSPKTSMSSL